MSPGWVVLTSVFVVALVVAGVPPIAYLIARATGHPSRGALGRLASRCSVPALVLALALFMIWLVAFIIVSRSVPAVPAG